MTDGAVYAEAGEGGVVEVVLDRPAKLNAMTSAMYRDFAEIFEGIASDSAVRCVILRGADARAFCVGSDIAEFAASIGDENALLDAAEIGRRAGDALLDCPVPVVAVISGACFGGGLQFACACDLRFAAPSASFGIPVKDLGMRAELPDLRAMLRALGGPLCLDLLLTGRTADAAEMSARGFLHALTDTPVIAARLAARQIASGAPSAARWHKRAVLALLEGRAGQLPDEARDCYSAREFDEGCAAFVEKRRPVFPPHTESNL